MKKLTKEEADAIKQRPNRRGGFVYGVLMGMRVGDIILLEEKDWTRKTQAPSTYCLQLGRKKNRKWTCNVAVDGSGWVIERVK